MQVGDRVGLLSGREHGTVVRVTDREVEVLLDEGVEVLLARSEVVPLRPMSSENSGKGKPVVPHVSDERPKPTSPEIVLIKEGVESEILFAQGSELPVPSLSTLLPDGPGLLLVETGSGRLEIWMVNPSAVPAWAALYRQSPGSAEWRRMAVREISPQLVVRVVDMPLVERDSLSRLLLIWQALPSETQEVPLAAAQTYRLGSRTWRKPTVALVTPDVRGVYLPLKDDVELTPMPIPTGEAPIRSGGLQFVAALPTEQSPVIDLHIEHVAPHLPGLSNTEKLMFQLEQADKSLDEAVRLGLRQLTFIHGVGKGILRERLHRLLQNHAHVATFFLDDSGKYGQGATTVVLL